MCKFPQSFRLGFAPPKARGFKETKTNVTKYSPASPWLDALQVIFGEFLLYFWTLFESGEIKLTQFNVFIFILCSLEMCRLIVSDIITASCTTQRVERIGQCLVSDVRPVLIVPVFQRSGLLWRTSAGVCTTTMGWCRSAPPSPTPPCTDSGRPGSGSARRSVPSPQRHALLQY